MRKLKASINNRASAKARSPKALGREEEIAVLR
jgi:hypothetical protein